MVLQTKVRSQHEKGKTSRAKVEGGTGLKAKLRDWAECQRTLLGQPQVTAKVKEASKVIVRGLPETPKNGEIARDPKKGSAQADNLPQIIAR
jgi:hypothetical protein